MTDPIWVVVVFLLVSLGIFLLRQRHAGNSQQPDAGTGVRDDTRQKSTAERSIQERPEYREAAATRATEAVTSPGSSAKPTPNQPSHSVRARDGIPQDSMLRRHYLTHVRSMVESLAPPLPTDSVLRRHHEHLVAARSESCLADSGQLEALVHEYQGLEA